MLAICAYIFVGVVVGVIGTIVLFNIVFNAD